jgi:hypothetical protein
MSLTITIDRTEGGQFRAEIGEHPRLIIEHNDLPALRAELKRTIDLIFVAPDCRLLFLEAKEIGSDADDAIARAKVERTALRNEELDELIDRSPVPAEWGHEPGWSDAL